MKNRLMTNLEVVRVQKLISSKLSYSHLVGMETLSGRVVNQFSLIFLLGIFGISALSTLGIIPEILQYDSVSLVAVAVVLGILFGAVSVGLITNKSLRNIEKKGIYTDFFVFWGILLLCLCIILGVCIFYFQNSFFGNSPNIFFSNQVIYASEFFIISTFSTGCLTRTLLSRNWERKNKRTLYENRNKIYAYPYITPTQ
jgi:hypothetical protein